MNARTVRPVPFHDRDHLRPDRLLERRAEVEHDAIAPTGLERALRLRQRVLQHHDRDVVAVERPRLGRTPAGGIRPVGPI
jgi:hypothetical protein